MLGNYIKQYLFGLSGPFTSFLFFIYFLVFYIETCVFQEKVEALMSYNIFYRSKLLNKILVPSEEKIKCILIEKYTCLVLIECVGTEAIRTYQL